MNIFVLHHHPYKAAKSLCDKHIPKMLLESAQMLCTAAHHLTRPDIDWPTIYKPAYVNHPCNVWVRASLQNYEWLAAHAFYLASEYNRRFHRRHASEDVLVDCVKRLHMRSMIFPSIERTEHPLCMPDEYKCSDPVESYRRYYIAEKSRFARWERGTPAPDWWPETTLLEASQ
jgi:hypothetical protein